MVGFLSHTPLNVHNLLGADWYTFFAERTHIKNKGQTTFTPRKDCKGFSLAIHFELDPCMIYNLTRCSANVNPVSYTVCLFTAHLFHLLFVRNDVKFAWKVQRDVAERGWTEEQVREPDQLWGMLTYCLLDSLNPED